MASNPTLETCNQDDPKEAFQWAFVALPFAGATPLMVDPNVRPEWSQMFWDLGFRHHPELQTKRVVTSVRGPDNPLNPAVAVIGVDDPDPDPVVIQDPATLGTFEQEIQLERYRQMGRLPKVEPVIEGAEVLSGPLFDPSQYTPSTVNGYLMAANPMERRRVLAAEMVGKKRDQILRKWPGE